MKSLNEFKQWFETAENDKAEQLPFVWEIMKSPYIEYHYSLITDKKISDGFRRNLISRFDEHGDEGETFLLSKLDNNEDTASHAEMIYLLGKLGNRHNSKLKNKTLDYARKLALSPDIYTRDRAIIVLGWIGDINDIPLLTDRLLNDPNNYCRAWAASSFMQMWFRNQSSELVDKALPYSQLSIKQEPDYFALVTMM